MAGTRPSNPSAIQMADALSQPLGADDSATLSTLASNSAIALLNGLIPMVCRNLSAIRGRVIGHVAEPGRWPSVGGVAETEAGRASLGRRR